MVKRSHSCVKQPSRVGKDGTVEDLLIAQGKGFLMKEASMKALVDVLLEVTCNMITNSVQVLTM